MRPLPFFVPDHSEALNVGLLLLILRALGISQRKKWLLNQERLLAFLYLIKHPVVLAKLLGRLDLISPALALEDTHSVASLAVNVDALFDHAHLKRLLRHAASHGLIAVSYRKTDGFLYALSEAGQAAADTLRGDYFDKARRYLDALEQVNSLSTAALNTTLSDIFKDR
jgi:hypothetical protein